MKLRLQTGKTRLAKCLLFGVTFALACHTGDAAAGNQKEEALADAVRVALARAISDPSPPTPQFSNIDDRLKYLRWLGEMSDRLKILRYVSICSRQFGMRRGVRDSSPLSCSG